MECFEIYDFFLKIVIFPLYGRWQVLGCSAKKLLLILEIHVFMRDLGLRNVPAQVFLGVKIHIEVNVSYFGSEEKHRLFRKVNDIVRGDISTVK